MKQLTKIHQQLIDAYQECARINWSPDAGENELQQERDKIVSLCQQVTHILESQTETPSSVKDQHLLKNIFANLIDPDGFSATQLWEHDQVVMEAARALYACFPSQLADGEEASYLLHFFVGVADNTSHRSQLFTSMLQGPRDHWKERDWDKLCTIASEMIYELYKNQSWNQSMAAVDALMTTLVQEAAHHKEGKKLLDGVVGDLIFQNSLVFYPDILPLLDGKRVIRSCIRDDQHNGNRVMMDHLDNAVSDEVLEAWFPKTSKKASSLAQHYPRLQALFDRRAITQQVEDNLGDAIHTKSARVSKM